jgi:UDP-GlcNAc:undecaprenyl-phosphate/decaprenyl-phosphate GlcNAc-1-phosphate transferase
MGEIQGFLLALAITAAAIPALARWAPSWGLVDAPGIRKTHEGEIPVVGGLAMGAAFLAVYVCIGALTDTAWAPSMPLSGAVAITLVGGVLDDRHDIGSLPKFAFQIAAALLIAWSGDALLTHVGRLMSTELFTLGHWSLPLTVFALVGVMNAINLADGLDGLAGALALAACLNFGIAASLAGHAAEFGTVCIAAGAATGFLAFNARSRWRARAAVFMGDTGSLLLGLLLGWLAVRLAMANSPALAPIAAVWILALPIGDTVTIMLRRILRGRSPFYGDREHLHHILLALGLSEGRAVATLFLLSLALGLAALAAGWAGVPEYVLFYVYMTGLIAWGITAELFCRRRLRNRP